VRCGVNGPVYEAKRAKPNNLTFCKTRMDKHEKDTEYKYDYVNMSWSKHDVEEVVEVVVYASWLPLPFNDEGNMC
jgi:hypothetical protein